MNLGPSCVQLAQREDERTQQVGEQSTVAAVHGDDDSHDGRVRLVG